MSKTSIHTVSPEAAVQFQPLVPRGADREAVVSAIVNAWCAEITGAPTMPLDVDMPGVTLNQVDLVDENSGEPIDLGELLGRVESQLRAAGLGPEFAPSPGRFVCLRSCRVRKCRCKGLFMRAQLACMFVTFDEFAFSECQVAPHLSCVACRFESPMMIDRSVIWGAPDYHFSTLTKGFQITGSEFAYFPRFFGAELGGSCRVDATKCLEGTCVHGVQFPPFTQFTRVSFRPSAIFFDVHFGAGACFSGVNFGDSGTFHHVVFEGPCRFERCKFGLPSLIETDLRGAVFQQVEFTSTSVPSDGRSWSARLAALDGWFKPVCRWDRVRAVGELQVLTRASYLALILVPILAGCWGVVQRQLEGFGKSMPLASVIDEVAQDVEKTARFPLSLALVFFAAAFVLLGHLLYQAKAPSLIKSRSRDEHMDDMTARYRSDSPEGRKERLREAIDKLHAIPAYDTARAANLVNRHGETVWLPSKLEWYADPPEYPIEANSMTQLTRLRAAEPDGATTRAVSAYVKRFRPLLLTGAERERIAVEEGARAKYDIESHQHRPLAAVAGTAYLFGVLLILWVLGLQLYRIADTAGAPWLLGLIVLAVVIGVFVAWRSRGESRTAEVIRTFDRT